MMVHKNIFDAIVKKGYTNWRGKFTIKSLIKDGWEIVEYFKKEQKKFKEDTKGLVGNELALASIPYISNIMNIDAVCTYSQKNMLKWWLVRVSEGSDFKLGKVMMRYLLDKVVAGATDDELEIIIKKMAEFSIFEYAFDLTRKTWMPQAGAGSQDDEYDIVETINEATANIIKSRREEYDE